MSGDQLAPVLIGGEWRPAVAEGSFQAFDPSTGQPLPQAYPISGRADLLAALEAGSRAADALAAASPAAIAAFLDDFAARIEAARAELVATAARETALP
ncbi:MAG TPA: aldehyde dehydrogenase (NADP(+)), partial [Herpetosiphonaceae bacterium]